MFDMNVLSFPSVHTTSFGFTSAGVGRTGTFIALDCLIEQADKEGQIDVLKQTYSMREERMNMIQTLVCIDMYSKV